jgi:predicted alpha/beta-fold hydrolase
VHITDFAAPRLLRNKHLQTLGAALPLWTWGEPEHQALRFDLPTGGALRARATWHRGAERTAVVMVHGIAGSTESNYMRRAALAIHRAGYHVVRVNVRGAGDSVPEAPSLHHAGLIEDPATAIDAVRGMEGVRDVVLFGFSLGGNVALKLAAAWKNSPPRGVRCVVSVSAPMDLVETNRELERFRAFPYRRYVVRGLVAQGLAYAQEHPDRARYDATRLPQIRTIKEYDDLVIAPMHDFSDAHDYYVRASCGPGLADVAIPCLVVHADDDPMVPAATVRPWLRDASSAITTAWSRCGGHVGWFAGMHEDAWLQTWAVDRALAFIARPD